MSDQSAQPQSATAPPTIVPVDLDSVLNALLNAVKALAEDAAPGTEGRLGADALAFAQAYVILHPTLVAPQGVLPHALNPPQAPRAQPGPGGQVQQPAQSQQNVPPAAGG